MAVLTAQTAFDPLLSPDRKIIAFPDLREYGTCPANQGHSLEALQKLRQRVDFGLVEKRWEVNKEKHQRQREARVVRVKKELWKLGNAAMQNTKGTWKHLSVGQRQHEGTDVQIVVVSHAGFLADLVRRGKSRRMAK